MTKPDAKEEIRLAERQIKQAEYCLKMAEQRKNNAEIELEKLERMDYSKWIGRSGDIFAINGNKVLYYDCYDNSLTYYDDDLSFYRHNFSYIDIPVSELKYGDCVCFYPEKREEGLNVSDFGFFVGFNNSEKPIFQSLFFRFEFERIIDCSRLKGDIIRKFIK